jgi:hypothetical protein
MNIFIENIRLVAGCWLLVAGCWLLVAGCWLLVIVPELDLNDFC